MFTHSFITKTGPLGINSTALLINNKSRFVVINLIVLYFDFVDEMTAQHLGTTRGIHHEATYDQRLLHAPTQAATHSYAQTQSHSQD